MVRVIRSPWLYTGVALAGYYLILFGLVPLPTDLSEISRANPLRTLLGALTTGLITAQALVFTVALVAAQLNARYTLPSLCRLQKYNEFSSNTVARFRMAESFNTMEHPPQLLAPSPSKDNAAKRMCSL